jgi:glycine/D-amino acid oxidase-like deaminating enzyme/nitrite reductase/ring-hydroxylating ferredoxin subunit
MNTLSVFEANEPRKTYPALQEDLAADVVIVGGGITGITAAYLLSRQGKSVVVLEALSVAKGATGNSTGNLYATVGNQGLHSIEAKFDEETVRTVVEARSAAVNFIEQRIQEWNIACDFKRVSWNLYSEYEQHQPYIVKEKDAARKAGLAVSEDIRFPSSRKRGFRLDNQAQFNPYLYVAGLAEKTESPDCRIFEHSKVLKVEEGDGTNIVYTSDGRVTAPHVIMATHTPKGVYSVHTLLGPYREYAMAVKLNGDYPPEGIFWELMGNEHYSMRTYESPNGKVLLVLGETHKVGQKEDNEECFVNLERFLRERFDIASVEYRWAAQQYKPADGLPYIGRTAGDSNVYIATGFSADGLTYGTLSAMIIADEIAGVENKWAKTFDPRRHNPLASAKEFIKENINVALQYVKDLPYVADASEFSEIQTGEGKTILLDGEKYAAYRDESGRLHVVSAVCTHMKCIVNWNKSEKSWDCPCHGSRFDYDGKVIEGPAIADLPKMVEKN